MKNSVKKIESRTIFDEKIKCLPAHAIFVLFISFAAVVSEDVAKILSQSPFLETSIAYFVFLWILKNIFPNFLKNKF